jgi:hypothetical protein
VWLYVVGKTRKDKDMAKCEENWWVCGAVHQVHVKQCGLVERKYVVISKIVASDFVRP